MIPGLVETPEPLRISVSGLSDALSLNVTLPERVPLAEGVNVTVIVQEAPTARLVGQLLVCVKSLEFKPWTWRKLKVRVATPLFVSVTVCTALVVPTV